MTGDIRVGDRVRIHLDSALWRSRGWFTGTVVRIDPYSDHRSFYWVALEEEIQDNSGATVDRISVFNPKNIQRLEN